MSCWRIGEDVNGDQLSVSSNAQETVMVILHMEIGWCQKMIEARIDANETGYLMFKLWGDAHFKRFHAMIADLHAMSSSLTRRLVWVDWRCLIVRRLPRIKTSLRAHSHWVPYSMRQFICEFGLIELELQVPWHPQLRFWADLSTNSALRLMKNTFPVSNLGSVFGRNFTKISVQDPSSWTATLQWLPAMSAICWQNCNFDSNWSVSMIIVSPSIWPFLLEAAPVTALGTWYLKSVAGNETLTLQL